MTDPRPRLDWWQEMLDDAAHDGCRCPDLTVTGTPDGPALVHRPGCPAER